MAKRTALLGFMMVIFIGACSLMENNIRQALWNIQRPEIYYIEIADSRLGERYHAAAIVSRDQIIRLEPKNYDANLTVFTVEQLFTILQSECGLWNTDCIVTYDNHHNFISALGVHDWRVLRVERFSECQTIQDCPR